jgi:uncharacterized repeat protein (TIGR01451 family)
VLKSLDKGLTWIKDLNFPNFSTYTIKDDSIFLAQLDINKKILFSKFPYTRWETINIDNIDYANHMYSDGIIYIETGESQKDIKRFKLDGTSLSSLLNDGNYYSSLTIDKNKIWTINAITNVLKLSNDYGKTWVDYRLPKTQIRDFKRVNNYLILTSETQEVTGNLSNKTGGVYLSADDGKSWFLYSGGIMLNNIEFSSDLYKIDSFIFASTIFHLWRINVKDLNLKSISGNVYLDSNKNGVKDSNEKPILGAQIYTSKTGGYTTTDSLGNYLLLVDLQQLDTLKVSIDSHLSSAIPSFYLVAVSDSTKNFGLRLPTNDLKITATAVTPPRNGFNNNYLVTYKNIGTAVASGKVNFSYVPKQTLVEALPLVTSNTNSTLSWNYANLQPNESRTINFTLKMAADMPVRTQITNVASIDPITTDTFKTNNVDSVYQTVVGSYDPNDKQVSFQNNKLPPSVFDQNSELTYTIRFQNTGNYQADFVRVTDTLNDKLDITTMRVLATSHNYVLNIKNKNVLIFEFNPIYLPDSTTNEKGSHGFIKFAIKPKRALTKDEVIKNTAQIYFDYNPAIITNTVETANQKVSSILPPSVFEAISVYPNPTDGGISFNLDKYLGSDMILNIYTVEGKLVMSKNIVNSGVNILDSSYLQTGLYVLQIKVGNEWLYGRFMKK